MPDKSGTDCSQNSTEIDELARRLDEWIEKQDGKVEIRKAYHDVDQAVKRLNKLKSEDEEGQHRFGF